jgi:riboflavin kinase/FMN adenylyltransferase
VVTSGTFDGVHVGHRKIINRLNATAQKVGGESVVITYWPHPRFVLGKDSGDLKLLSTFEEKAELLANLGINHLIKIEFTPEFAGQSSQEFIQQTLVEAIGTRHLVIGYDHRFGKNREGSFEHLVANKDTYGFQVEEIPKQEVDDVGVSSTRIRKALAQGEVDIANTYLARPYQFSGTVVEGQQLGRKLGYPTANLEIKESYKLVPADGVYAVNVSYNDQVHPGMMSIGLRPTIAESLDRTIEIHIFNFEGNLYGQALKVDLLAYLRPEEKLRSLDSLKAKIQEDELNARKFFNI